MKRFLPALFMMFAFSASAQIVNIPDPNFKNALVHYSDLFGRIIDSNNDGEIQYSEAASFSNINGGYYLDISYKNISDLTGIKAFTDLETLFCNNNNLTALDVSGMSLELLQCQNNVLTFLNLSGCNNLERVSCHNNQLSGIDLSGQNNLNYLAISNNLLTSLDISDAPQLHTLWCEYNQLTALDISQNSLSGLNCSYNQLTNLNIKDHHNFYYTSNAMTRFTCLGNSALQYICADAGEILYLLEYFILNGQSNMQVDSSCSFSTSTGYGTINGTVRIDLDNNGCSLSDPVKPQLNLRLIKDSDTLQQLLKTTDISGQYVFYSYAGSHFIVPSLQNPYFTVTPDTLHFTATAGASQNLDFCIIPNGIHNDLDIKINYVTAFGDSCHTMIFFKNKGTQPLSGTIQLAFDDNKLNFAGSQIPINSQSTGLVTWNFNNLQPFETRTIDNIVWYMLPYPINQIGDTLTFTASINFPGIDETPADNTSIFKGPIGYVVLPISMEYFKGNIQSGKHNLTWKANCTSIQAIFDIERSIDGRKYNSIASITASNSRCLQPFDLTDNDPAPGMNYYRIKMIDVDGKISYSSTIALLNKKSGFEIVNLLPNPVTDGKALLNITSAEKQGLHITVSDASGKLVQSVAQPVIQGFTQLNMNFSTLAAGLYTITVYTAAGERKTKQFIKK